MDRKRWAGRAAVAMLAGAAALSGWGLVQAGPAPSATQVSNAVTGSIAYAFIPPAWGDGTPAFEALLVEPGPGSVTTGSDGHMNMGRPWAALRAYSPDSSGLGGATPSCTTLTNPAIWHIDAPARGTATPLTASFDAVCGGTVYRVNWTEWGFPFQSTMTAPYALESGWGSAGTSSTAIHLSYLEGAYHYAAQAQICHQVPASGGGATWACYAATSGDAVIAPDATALMVQELANS